MRVEGVLEVAKPDADAARAMARHLFITGERVDMGALARRLDVGRSTLYRWVGDREELISGVLANLSRETWELSRAEAQGDGFDRAIDVVRKFMVYTSEFGPLRDFVQREPELALRILLRAHSPVTAAIRDGIAQAVAEHAPGLSTRLSPELLDAVAEACTALEWTPVIIGQHPDVDRILTMARTLLQA